MNVEVYDIETLYNCFTYTGYNTKEDKWYQFVIHDSVNNLVDLVDHIKNDLIMMVGYNNEGFDYPVIHWIINNYVKILLYVIILYIQMLLIRINYFLFQK